MTLSDKLRSLNVGGRIDGNLFEAVAAHIDSMAATDQLKDRLIDGMTAHAKMLGDAFAKVANENQSLRAELESLRKAQP